MSSLKPILFCRIVPKYAEKRVKNSMKITVFLRTFWQKYNPNCLAILCYQSDICTTEKERRVHIMKNEIRFTLESKQRPKLAQEIGNILGTVPHYERVPSCAYDIAGYRLDKEGVLHIPE